MNMSISQEERAKLAAFKSSSVPIKVPDSKGATNQLVGEEGQPLNSTTKLYLLIYFTCYLIRSVLIFFLFIQQQESLSLRILCIIIKLAEITRACALVHVFCSSIIR